MTNYSIQYYNFGHYPLPQTILVIIVELIKLTVIITRLGGNIPSISKESLKSSLKFIIPSVFYSINNNIYFAGLLLVPPPIWIILCSFRTVITATVYKARK